MSGFTREVSRERRLLQPVIEGFELLKRFDKATPLWLIPVVKSFFIVANVLVD